MNKMTHQYRTTRVEAFNLRLLDSDQTQSVPTWVVRAITENAAEAAKEGIQWVVQKPDHSFGFYTGAAFINEFEQLPGAPA